VESLNGKLRDVRARHYSPELGRFMQRDPVESRLPSHGWPGHAPSSVSDANGLAGVELTGYFENTNFRRGDGSITTMGTDIRYMIDATNAPNCTVTMYFDWTPDAEDRVHVKRDLNETIRRHYSSLSIFERSKILLTSGTGEFETCCACKQYKLKVKANESATGKRVIRRTDTADAPNTGALGGAHGWGWPWYTFSLGSIEYYATNAGTAYTEVQVSAILGHELGHTLLVTGEDYRFEYDAEGRRFGVPLESDNSIMSSFDANNADVRLYKRHVQPVMDWFAAQLSGKRATAECGYTAEIPDN
jgi:hypothetical protein